MLSGQCVTSPDSAHIAGTALAGALVEDDRELHLVSRLQLQAVLHLLHVEEQLLALAHLVRDETKLQTRSKTQSKIRKTQEKSKSNFTLNIHNVNCEWFYCCVGAS